MTFAFLLKTIGKAFPNPNQPSQTMTSKETTYLVVLIVLAVCLFVSLIFNVFFMIDMYYHVWCYGKRGISRRRRSSSSDSDSDSDIEASATPHQHLYTVTGRSGRRSSATITMLNSGRADDSL